MEPLYLYEWEYDKEHTHSFWGKYRVVGVEFICISTDVNLIGVKDLLPKGANATFSNVQCKLEIKGLSEEMNTIDFYASIEPSNGWFSLRHRENKSTEDILVSENFIEVTKY